ncbi:hypothetical protein Sjap_000466 [Stephania japonica]|uniref:MORF/ORRM1/DAG-like MORF domain-containing protein n=1 Tax=Stephania japonica TaxID=461633 RepID=A0AAP0KI38_9MAGN
MAISFLGRTLVTKPIVSSIFSLSFRRCSSSSPPLLRLRPLVALNGSPSPFRSSVLGLRCLATRPTTSSLNDPSPNWNNRPPKETILLDGCDFEHWLIVMEKPEGEPSRDEIIDSYVKTLAMVLGSSVEQVYSLNSEEEARKSMYSVSTKYYFAFGCIVSEEISYKIKELPRVRWVLPDSYLDVKNKDYGGEPVIDGKAVPYDPKYHEDWIRNNARANERSRRNDRPRNFDRSRNFERRRENMQNRDFQDRGVPNAAPNTNMYNNAPNLAGMPPSANTQNTVPNMGGMPSNPSMQSNYGNVGGGMSNAANRDFQYGGGGGSPYQNREAPGGTPNFNYNNNYMPNRDGGKGGSPY